MAYLFSAASSQYLVGSAAPSTEPLTMACWYRPTDSSGSRVVLSVGRSTGSGRYQLFEAGGTALTAQRINDAGSTLSSSISSTITTGQFFHFAATFGASGQAITVWLNGVAGTPATNDGSAITVDRMLVGTRLSGGTPGAYANGDIAEAGVWGVALTAEEIAGLAKGFRCRMIRPQSLRFDLRMIRNLQDLSQALAMTNTNGATVSTHPRIIYP